MTKSLKPSEKLEISRFCACLGNPTILSIIEALAKNGQCHKDDFIELDGLSSFTINMNLKYLKKFDLVRGSLSVETPYYLNYKKIEKSKRLFDEFYQRVVQHNSKKKIISHKNKKK
jgi:hypothetical protein